MSEASTWRVADPSVSLRQYFAAHAPPMPEWFLKYDAFQHDCDATCMTDANARWPWHHADTVLAAEEDSTP